MLRHFLSKVHMLSRGAFQVALGAKNPPVNDMRHGFNPWVGKIPWLHGNPLQYSCLEKPMDRGAWGAPQGLTELDMTEVIQHTQRRVIKIVDIRDHLKCCIIIKVWQQTYNRPPESLGEAVPSVVFCFNSRKSLLSGHQMMCSSSHSSLLSLCISRESKSLFPGIW